MQHNPESECVSTKHKTIQDYINQDLQLKTLKIKKFQFQNSLSLQHKSSRKLRFSQTPRQVSKDKIYQNQHGFSKWEPKLSYRKLANEPKVLLSVQRKKMKSSESSRRGNYLVPPPMSRLGFRGEKIKSNSFYVSQSQQKIPQKLILNKTAYQQGQKTYRKVPNFHFNYKYIIDQRKKRDKVGTVEQETKKGSNRGYFACFGSQNFKKYLQKNIYRPNTQTSALRQQVLCKKQQATAEK